jgi:release factor glutamine methyltransferase
MHQEISSYEPRLAFDGGPFGIAIIQRLIKEAPRYLREGGWLGFEVGLGQGAALMKRLNKDTNYSELKAITDSVGETRAILAKVQK